MKNIIKQIIAFIFIFCILSLSSNAHPGRTDSNGGHWNHKTGEYHYHTGEYAGRKQSNSSSDYEYEPFAPPKNPEENEPDENAIIEKSEELEKTTPETEKATSNSYIWGRIVLYFIIGWFLIGSIPILVFVYESIINLLPKPKLSEYEISINKLKSACQELDKLQEKFIITSVNSTPPVDVLIGKDGLPKEKNSDNWGKLFTGYISTHGQKIHFKRGCGNAYKKTHLYYYRDACCRNCYRNISVPDLSWFDLYLKSKDVERSIERKKEYILSIKQELDKHYKRCNSKLFRLFSSKTVNQKVCALNKQYMLLSEIAERKAI